MHYDLQYVPLDRWDLRPLENGDPELQAEGAKNVAHMLEVFAFRESSTGFVCTPAM